MESQFPVEVLRRIEKSGVIAVLVVDRVEHGPLLARALLDGGVDYLEGQSVEEKRRNLRNISYLDFLERYAGMPEPVRGLLQDTFLPLTAVKSGPGAFSRALSHIVRVGSAGPM